MNKWDKLIFFIIILSIIHLFLEEIGVILGWTISFRHLLIWIGFTFDLIFTIEFIIRYSIAHKNGRVKEYMYYEGGLVDFFASIPLLLFYSGVRVYFLVTITSPLIFYSSSMIGIFRAIKLIRIVRLLRFMRILKIVGRTFQWKIENFRKNIMVVSTISIGSFIVGIFLIKLIFVSLGWPGVEIFKYKRSIEYKKLINIAEDISTRFNTNFSAEVERIFQNQIRALQVSIKDKILISKYSDEELFEKYDVDDLMLLQYNNVNILFTVIDVNKQIAKNNIELIFLILIVLSGILIFYIPFYKKIAS